MRFRDRIMKLHFCKIQIKSLFWFQVRAKNNIHNQIKSGASKQPTNILFTISPYVHQRAPKEGVGSISKFTFTCDLKRKKKNVTGSTMHTARFLFLKSAIPFLKVKKYISIFLYICRNVVHINSLC